MSWWRRKTDADDASLQFTLAHIAMRLFNQPLMILPEKLTVIEQAIGSRFGVLTTPPKAELTEDQKRRRPYSIQNGTAIINVFGSLVQRASGAEAESGLTSYQQLSRELAMALEDADAQRMLFLVDSPGGEAAGVWDFVDQIAAAKKKKPTMALIDGMGASAAYAIASAAEQLYVTQGSTAGSIGVIASHVDQSKFDEKMGVTITHIFAGAHKADFSPHAPLTDGALAEIEKLVNDAYTLFVEKVSMARGLTAEAVRNTEARLFTTAEAEQRGLINGVRTFAQLINDRPSAEGPITLRQEVTMADQQPITTLAQLREAYPALLESHAAEVKDGIVATVEQQATRNERARIQEILTLAGVELPAYLVEACFEKPVSAGDAAKVILTKKVTVGKTKAAAFLNDAEAPVDASPSAGANAAQDIAIAAARAVNAERQKKLGLAQPMAR